MITRITLNAMIVTATACGLASCASTPEAETSADAGVAYSPTTIVAAQAPARTRIEPVPTSYVLFPSFKRPEDNENNDIDEYFALAKAAEEKYHARVTSYCIGHLRAFALERQTTEADPFMNTLKMFWPVTQPIDVPFDVIELDGDQILNREEVTRICKKAAENYDYLRADRMLATYSASELADVGDGPVFVLDMGAEELVLDRSDADTEPELEGLATVWRDQVFKALKDVENEEKKLIQRRVELTASIAQLRERAKNEDLKKSDRRQARDASKKLQRELKDIDKKLFAKNSTERKIACLVGEGLKSSRVLFFADGLISDVMDNFCETDDD